MTVEWRTGPELLVAVNNLAAPSVLSMWYVCAYIYSVLLRLALSHPSLLRCTCNLLFASPWWWVTFDQLVQNWPVYLLFVTDSMYQLCFPIGACLPLLYPSLSVANHVTQRYATGVGYFSLMSLRLRTEAGNNHREKLSLWHSGYGNLYYKALID